MFGDNTVCLKTNVSLKLVCGLGSREVGGYTSTFYYSLSLPPFITPPALFAFFPSFLPSSFFIFLFLVTGQS